MIRAAMRKYAGGGKLGGYGGGDTIKALLEPGEFVIRKEAVKKYGAAIFEALNSMNLDIPDFGVPKVMRAAGGMVPAYQTGGLVDQPMSAGVRVDKIVISPTYMSGDRSTAKRFAVEVKRELDALEARRGRR
jgi:hypothetical protein